MDELGPQKPRRGNIRQCSLIFIQVPLSVAKTNKIMTGATMETSLIHKVMSNIPVVNGTD